MNPNPNNFNQPQKMTTSTSSSASVNATPLDEFTKFDQGDPANILHDLRDTVRDLSSHISSGLTPAAAGVPVSEKKPVRPPIHIPKHSSAAPGPFSSLIPQQNDHPPHFAHFSRDKYVPPHQNTQNQSRYHNSSSPDVPL